MNKVYFYLLIGLFLSSQLLALVILELKYIRYAVPYLGLLFVYDLKVNKKLITSLYAVKYLILISLIIAFSFASIVIISQDFYIRFLQESFFLISPPIFVYVLLHFEKEINDDRVITIFFISYAVTYLLQNVTSLGSFSFKILLQSLIYAPKGDTESVLGLSFGLFAIYYLNKKNLWLLFISILLTILSFKRIVFIAVIIAFFCYFFFNKFNRNSVQKYLLSLGIAANIAALILLLLFANGYFNELIHDITGISANIFTKGRFAIYSFMDSLPYNNIFTGIGLGKTSLLIDANNSLHVSLLHSDVLKIYYEFGIIIFILFFSVIYKYLSSSVYLFTLMVYMNVLFLVDNVLIYFPTQLLFLLLINIEMMKEKLNEQ